MLGMADLLAQTGLDQLILTMKLLFTFVAKHYLNEEFYCTKAFPFSEV